MLTNERKLELITTYRTHESDTGSPEVQIAKDAYLNVAVPDAGSTGNDTLTVSGTITLVWSNLGDV